MKEVLFTIAAVTACTIIVTTIDLTAIRRIGRAWERSRFGIPLPKPQFRWLVLRRFIIYALVGVIGIIIGAGIDGAVNFGKSVMDKHSKPIGHTSAVVSISFALAQVSVLSRAIWKEPNAGDSNSTHSGVRPKKRPLPLKRQRQMRSSRSSASRTEQEDTNGNI